ncbi:MAG: hypothetical protein ACRD2O_09635 [Terriglobia bacterium]
MIAWEKLQTTARWAPSYFWQRFARPIPSHKPLHLILGLADHFEPAFNVENPQLYAPRDVGMRRLENWIGRYPMAVDSVRDSDGFPLRHTYFFPAEQYDPEQIEMLAHLCHQGWGEVEIHLHHGVRSPDTSENTRRVLVDFRDALVRYGCLSRLQGSSQPRYAFVHGNWTLANSGKGCCGVDDEMQILAETGCYADLTLPAAPSPAQTAKINSVYECALPLSRRAPHRRGYDLKVGRKPKTFPLIIQGPLGLVYRRKANGRRGFTIENSELACLTPPSMERMKFWIRTGVQIQGRPDWIFIKLHCHGMDPRDQETLLGQTLRRFLEDLKDAAQTGGMKIHFVTAREMANIALAACDGRDGDPGKLRDYLLTLTKPAKQ